MACEAQKIPDWLSDEDKRALRGEMTFAEYEEHGMSMFQRDLVHIDPLAGLMGQQETKFPLSDYGRAVAIELRKQGKE